MGGQTRGDAAVATAPAAAHDPLRGSLYAQLLRADDGRLRLRCSQKLWLAKHTAVKLFGMFADGEAPRLRAQIKSKLFVTAPSLRISGRVRHEFSNSTCKATVYIKNRVKLGEDTALNAKVELHARAQVGVAGKALTDGGRDVQARLELSHKVLNITDSQDCRLRVGLDLLSLDGYVEARENHLSIKLAQPLRGAASGCSWSVLYDL